MSESILNEIRTVNHKQAAALILANPNVRYMLRGEPGVGKSMIAAAIAEATGYDLSMVDVPNLDLGDVAMPVIDHEHKVTRYYPNARFGLTTGKPVVICLDEFTKGADPVKNMLHPMLEVFRPRLGDFAIPEGSIIFMTGNMDTDGVGDGLAQHTRQRVVELVVRKSNATEWLQWAAANGIHPVVMAWVDSYPQALASYLDGAHQ
jgi:MoxR-like ATPase